MSDHDWEVNPFPVGGEGGGEGEEHTESSPLGLAPWPYSNEEDVELIGVKDAVFRWCTESGTDNSTDDDGNSGLHVAIFDITSRADGAQIKLLNDSGSNQYFTGGLIIAKPIVRRSGLRPHYGKTDGWIHDDFIDYEDIALNGENIFEFGNNYIISKAQLDQLADYFAKTLGVIQGDTLDPFGNPLKNKHIYGVSIAGRCWWFEPGEWYTIQIGGAGQREYIDSVCECYSVQVEAGADGLGTTRVLFREVEQNWVKDSNATARFLATGDPRWRPNNFGRVIVASSTYMGVAGYYCGGTADQTEIQAAIDYVAKSFGGGLIELTEGQFNTTAAIDLSYNNIILRGAGAKTIIEKNCNDYGIKAIGISGTEISNIMILDLKITRNTSDTNNNVPLIYLYYVDRSYLQGLSIINSYDFNIQCSYCDSLSIIECIILNCALYHGINFTLSNDYLISHCIIKNNGGLGVWSSLSCERGLIDGCEISDNEQGGIALYGNNSRCTNNTISGNKNSGIYIDGDNNNININTILNNGVIPSSTSARNGISISSNCENTRIMSNYCSDNGTLIDHANCESIAVPHITGDAFSLSGCTEERSTEQYYGGAYSRKITQTDASTGEFRFCDNITKTDLHGIYPGYSYALSAYTYLLSTGSPTTAEVKLILGYTTGAAGAWHETTGYVSTGKDAWGLAETTAFAIPASAAGAKVLVRINAAASTDEYFYIDNIRLKPLGTHNLYNQNFYDGGTGTHWH